MTMAELPVSVIYYASGKKSTDSQTIRLGLNIFGITALIFGVYNLIKDLL